MSYQPLSQKEEDIATAIVDAAYKVHSTLGPGLVESIYEVCFCHELKKHDLAFQRQMNVPITYDSLKLDAALRLDVLVENLVICELKAVEEVIPLFEAQLLSYMKLLQKRLGFLINFHVPVIKDGLKRMIL